MVGWKQPLLAGGKKEKARQRVAKVQTGLSSVSCAMPRQWDWVLDHEQLD